ncbi:MAG TPA: Do family serine endopeptidase [Stellaceae bacterium]|jgi:Do/DeqQ family serine protease
MNRRRGFAGQAAGSLLLLLAASAVVPAKTAGAAGLPEVAGSGVPSLAPVLKQVTPGVVNISTRARVAVQQNPLLQDPFFRRFFNIPEQQRTRETQATGSGVIVDARQGYVITNNHVVDNADAIEVTTKDNRRFRAKLVGRDADTDIAVLKIDPTNLTALEFGDSDRLEVGDFVLAIGNPFGLGQTVTSGIVSALGRSGLGIEGYEDFIQTDASINPGNSGGALVDLTGRLVGINTAILAPGGGNIGIGFAVPINMVKLVMEQLIRYGEVKRGRIGVAIQELTPEVAQALGTARTEGALIAQVAPGSSAERGGLRSGDIITAVNDVPIRSATQLRNRIGLTRVNETLGLTVERKGQTRTVAVRIDQVEDSSGDRAAPPRPRRQQFP